MIFKKAALDRRYRKFVGSGSSTPDWDSIGERFNLSAEEAEEKAKAWASENEAPWLPSWIHYHEWEACEVARKWLIPSDHSCHKEGFRRKEIMKKQRWSEKLVPAEIAPLSFAPSLLNVE